MMGPNVGCKANRSGPDVSKIVTHIGHSEASKRKKKEKKKASEAPQAAWLLRNLRLAPRMLSSLLLDAVRD